MKAPNNENDHDCYYCIICETLECELKARNRRRLHGSLPLLKGTCCVCNDLIKSLHFEQVNCGKKEIDILALRRILKKISKIESRSPKGKFKVNCMWNKLIFYNSEISDEEVYLILRDVISNNKAIVRHRHLIHKKFIKSVERFEETMNIYNPQ
jgi:hypothetical protein